MMIADDGKPMLEGIKIIDLTSVVFGPYCTHILAELGAEVIKIEAPGAGDGFRWSGKANATPGMSPGFLAINRGKQSVALNLKDPDDLACMKTLLTEADVFVLNVRGKAVERLGLDYPEVKALNPAIVSRIALASARTDPMPTYRPMMMLSRRQAVRQHCCRVSTAILARDICRR